MSNLKQVIDESFTQYAGAVLQSRALVDARDCLKPSARQIFYCLYTDKFLPNKPFKKTLKAIGSIARMYIHGDSSAEGVIMRAGQPFAMRYPLIEVEGNEGNLMMSGNWAAPRYTASRLSDFSVKLFNDIDKDTIAEWRDNYDDTEQYPAVLPTKGYYNIVNGCMGIGIGAACSIPQFNLEDVNNSLEYLLLNPNCQFDDIYCPPDFATGAILLNEKEVKDSLKKGTGSACKLRSVVEYDSNERCFIVKEIPYSVYTNTICTELEKLLESDENPGVDRFNDLTGEHPLIKIYLSKRANPDKILKYLYKNTSLQSYYGINMTMLDNGRFPRVFTWKEALQAHIDHEKEVYRRGFEFDLFKIENRIHIINGLLICLARIEEVIQTIKNSSSTSAASMNLQSQFILDAEQAKAVLDMKLSRLAHLEVKKLEDEKIKLLNEANKIKQILENSDLFNNELITGWREMSKKYGDARRTKILNIEGEEDEPTEVKTLQLSLTNKENVFVTECSSLYTQRRGGVGTKLKLDSDEYIVASSPIESNEEVLFFTTSGDYYHTSANNFTLNEKMSLYTVFSLRSSDHFCAFTALNHKTVKPYIIFITKNGLIKKSDVSEYNIKRNAVSRALNLDVGDEIIDVLFTTNEKIGLMTAQGNFLEITTEDIRSIGRIARGIKGIKLNEDDYVVSAKIIPNDSKFIVSITGNGLFKKTDISEFSIQGKNTKGAKIHKLVGGDWMADFLPICGEADVLIASTRSCIKLSVNDIPLLSRAAQGNKSIKLAAEDNVVKISRS